MHDRQALSIVLTVAAYFFLLLVVSRLTARRRDNDAFFRGNRQSPWYMVAFGMIGASISGVTFVSVPGMVNGIGMTYMQTCLGFILGYAAVAFILLPIYYRHNLTTIYSFLRERLGGRSYTTGASFFILSKMTGAAARFYVVCIILQHFVLDAYGVPFPLTVLLMVVLIWLYTRQSGIRTLVWTDTLQTLCMFGALVLIILGVMDALGMGVGEAVKAVAADSRNRIFVFDDPMSRQYFWKQFLSGIFIVIVMTGLDQDMMQKTSPASHSVRQRRICARMVSLLCRPTCSFWLWVCCCVCWRKNREWHCLRLVMSCCRCSPHRGVSGRQWWYSSPSASCRRPSPALTPRLPPSLPVAVSIYCVSLMTSVCAGASIS